MPAFALIFETWHTKRRGSKPARSAVERIHIIGAPSFSPYHSSLQTGCTMLPFCKKRLELANAMRAISAHKARLKVTEPSAARRRSTWMWRVLSLSVALPLFWTPVSSAEDSMPAVAGPSPALAASEAGPSPSPTPTPPQTAAQDATFAAAFRRAWDAANKRRYHDAITEYNEAIRLKPDDPSVYHNRGVVYQILKQYSQAIADYSEAIRLKPDLAEAYNDRGNSYSALQQFDQAIPDCTAAIGLRPGFAEAYYNRGLAYDRLRQHEKAAADYSEVIRLKQEGQPGRQ